MPFREPIVAIRRLIPALVLLAMATVACGDDPFLVRWTEDPRERVIYSLDRDERNRPSAFEMLQGRQVVLESPEAIGRWDFALDRQAGELVLLPPRALGVTSDAGIAPIPGVRYEDVREAPRDTAAYVMRTPVPLEMGTIYVIRTHQQPGPFGQQCSYYGKVEPLEIDSATGVFRFLFDTSPDCNNRSLVPPS